MNWLFPSKAVTSALPMMSASHKVEIFLEIVPSAPTTTRTTWTTAWRISSICPACSVFLMFLFKGTATFSRIHSHNLYFLPNSVKLYLNWLFGLCIRQTSIKNRSSLGEGFFNSMVLSVRTFTAKTCYFKNTESDNSHSVQIPLVRTEVPLKKIISQNCCIVERIPGKMFFQITTVLIFASLGLNVFYPTYLCDMHFLHPSFTSLHQPHLGTLYHERLWGLVLC